MIRNYFHIDLNKQTVEKEAQSGEQLVKIGRYLIAQKLLENAAATIDPLSPENPLIFSAGPLAGTTFSNANRISVGCKSPLTGGVKEANGGGTFAYALGQLAIAGFTFHGASDEWVVMHIAKDGTVAFDTAVPYLGKGNFETAVLLHKKYGKKVSLALCGPVGEQLGLLAGIAFSDSDRRPSRLAARGGVGAVMGSKKIKAIVVDMDKTPQLHERQKVMNDIKSYAQMLRDDSGTMQFYNQLGTMGMADFTNHIGGLPVRNFSSGQLADTTKETFKMGADFIRPQNIERGGNHTHACMPGCVIQCSNVYADAAGKEVVSPVEYETLGLLGTNCGISDPDMLATLNHIANDLGIDTIETGATLALLMEAGLAEFGDMDFMVQALREIKDGTENGRIWAQGTARVGEHYNVARVPVIKKQAISAYDPRVIEVTGLSMMVTAQGADHTAGNAPRAKTDDMDVDEIKAMSLDSQITSAATDSLGLCVFGRNITNAQTGFLASAINHALGTDLDESFFMELGRETLVLEKEFNALAGFTAVDDNLPEFFYKEPLFPTNRVARFHAEDVHSIFDEL